MEVGWIVVIFQAFFCDYGIENKKFHCPSDTLMLILTMGGKNPNKWTHYRAIWTHFLVL